MGVAAAATAGHTPKVSRMRRVPFDNAAVASSKIGCAAASGGTASINATRTSSPLSATPRLAPTMPPPTMAISNESFTPRTSASPRLHQALESFGSLFERRRQDLRSAPGHQYVVLYSNADVPELPGYAGRGANVNARLHGQRHTGLEDPPLSADLRSE